MIWIILLIGTIIGCTLGNFFNVYYDYEQENKK